MLISLKAMRRRRASPVSVDERRGEACGPACRSAARREHDLARSLERRGPR